MKKIGLVLYLGIIAIFVGLGLFFLHRNGPPPLLSKLSDSSVKSVQYPIITPSVPVIAETAVVKRVIDGDTILLADDRRVRYIGINTAEMKTASIPAQCFAQEATDINRKLVEGKTITMKRDVSETDKYKRLLRYIWVGDIFVNDYLAREGFAYQDTVPPDISYALLFKQAAQEAQVKNKGLWNVCK